MLKFSYANTTMILSTFYVFIQWLRRVSISLFFDRPEMLSSFEKGRPEMLVTGDAYHWGMTVHIYDTADEGMNFVSPTTGTTLCVTTMIDVDLMSLRRHGHVISSCHWQHLLH